MSTYFFQIFLSSLDEKIPDSLLKHSLRFQQLFPDCQYILFTKNDLRSWMASNMPREVLWSMIHLFLSLSRRILLDTV